MLEKGFETEISLEETPNLKVTEDKPLKSSDNQSKKVDINVLKARVQEVESREHKKNIIIFIFFLLILGAIGVFLSV